MRSPRICPQITHITPSVDKQATVQYENRSFTFTVSGNDPNVYSIRSLKLGQGRFYNMEDQVQHGRVAVIGSEAKEKLFSGTQRSGRTHPPGWVELRSGGRAQRQDAGRERRHQSRGVRPVHHHERFEGHALSGHDLVQLSDAGIRPHRAAVRTILAGQHKFNSSDRQAVRVFNLMTQLHQFEIITLGLKILLGFIGTLTLGIGGVGLMNIMLVSVTQRTREIGVLKALGAKSRYILLQFLAEALTITFIGGVLGVILAYTVALSVGRLTFYSAFAKNGEAGDIRLIIAPGTLIASTIILGAVGLISGMVPAFRAARLDPIESLRHE